MLRVTEHAERTDTGRQRRGNEDGYLARSPLFAIADGMGGAQAGEVASKIAVETLAAGMPEGPGSVEERLRTLVAGANLRIHELSTSGDEYSGMGTTLTLMHAGESEITLAHVGDSRGYRWRDGSLERLTTDHTLVEELVRQGRLTPEEASGHPQRSVITRALGPERDVSADPLTVPARAGDVYLLSSDGLTDMVPEPRIGELLGAAADLTAAARSLVAAANDAGGRDNITVVLFRLGDAGAPAAADGGVTQVGAPALRAEDVRRALEQSASPAASPEPARVATEPRAPLSPSRRRRRRLPRPGFGTALILALVVTVAAGAYLASQAVYFVGPGREGFVTLYRGVPLELPGGIDLYQEVFVSGVADAQLTARQRGIVREQSLRSRSDADDWLRQLEQGSVGT
jgi:protein phosphatase